MWVFTHPFSWSQSHLLPVPQEWGDIQGMQGFAPLCHSGNQSAPGLAAPAAFLPFLCLRSWKQPPARVKRDFSTHCRDISLWTFELVLFQQSYSQPPGLQEDGITRALHPPQPRCNWRAAPALPARILSSFSQTPPVERSRFWGTALPGTELTPSPGPAHKKAFLIRCYFVLTIRWIKLQTRAVFLACSKAVKLMSSNNF